MLSLGDYQTSPYLSKVVRTFMNIDDMISPDFEKAWPISSRREEDPRSRQGSEGDLLVRCARSFFVCVLPAVDRRPEQLAGATGFPQASTSAGQLLRAAGGYTIDPDRASVVAASRACAIRGASSASTGWITHDGDDPADPADSCRSPPRSRDIDHLQRRLAQELSATNFLKPHLPRGDLRARLPADGRLSAGKVDGQLTLMGKTESPVTFDVELVGAGKGFADRPHLGVAPTASSIPSIEPPALFGDSMRIVLDVGSRGR